eukprot:1329881-Amorphochlora_amoeboformis.AAC.2
MGLTIPVIIYNVRVLVLAFYSLAYPKPNCRHPETMPAISLLLPLLSLALGATVSPRQMVRSRMTSLRHSSRQNNRWMKRMTGSDAAAAPGVAVAAGASDVPDKSLNDLFASNQVNIASRSTYGCMSAGGWFHEEFALPFLCIELLAAFLLWCLLP